MPAATAAPRAGVQHAARRRAHLDRAVGAGAIGGMSGSVSTRTANRQAERVTASGQLRLPSCWGALPAKSSSSRSPSTAARRRSTQIAVGRLEHVLGAGARRRAAPPGTRACAARSSRAPRRCASRSRSGRGARRARRGAARRCGWPRAGRAGRRGARRGWRICVDELLDRVLVERARRDHDALLRERAAVGRHRPGHARRRRRRGARGWRRSRSAAGRVARRPA